jgi:gamma-glutamyltranspeptidase/glutathione hydrolase
LSVNAGVAAGHPATADAGAEILADGGTAADAAVAAALASCVAETVMTGLLGGGHAIYYDAASGTARNLDFFCAMPGLGVPARESELVHMRVPFGVEVVHYAIGLLLARYPACPRGSTRCGSRKVACRGRVSSSLHSASRVRASQCHPRTSHVSRCSSR